MSNKVTILFTDVQLQKYRPACESEEAGKEERYLFHFSSAMAVDDEYS